MQQSGDMRVLCECVVVGCLYMCVCVLVVRVRVGASYNRLKSKQKDIQNEAERIRLQPAFVV